MQIKTIKNLLQKTEKMLSKISKEARLESELLLCFTLKKEKEYLFQNPDSEISKSAENKFKKLVKIRITGLPLYYILGKKEFFGLDFKVTQGVLIPRPETEELIEYFLKSKISKKKNLVLADIGTGCGCIAVIIAKKLPHAKIYATDISENALKVARANAKHHNILKRIKFLKGDLLFPLPEKVNAIIANLPYVSEKNYQKYFENLKFEPADALLAGKNGTLYLKKIIKEAPKYLKPDGEIFLEISPDLTPYLNKELKNLAKMKAKFIKDLSKKVRILHLK